MRKFFSLIVGFSALFAISACTPANTSAPEPTPAPTPAPVEQQKPEVQPDTSAQEETKNTAPSMKASNTQPPIYGNSESKHKITVFSDFECPACREMHKIIDPIFFEFAEAGKLKIEFRQFPLSYHKSAQGHALAALCAGEQGEYIAYAEKLYTTDTTDDAGRINLAKEISEIDIDTFSKCLESKKYDKQIVIDTAIGNDKQLEGTPMYLLDDAKIDLAQFANLEGFKAFLEKVVNK